MSVLVGLLNLVLGMAYTTYGVLTLVDMKRGWTTMGFSHFGAAWVAMAFTCGPHHVEHGLHNLVYGRAGGPLDLVAVLVGLPMGLTWLYLRIEAFLGGRGDRHIGETPTWLVALPLVGAGYLALLLAGVYALPTMRANWRVVPNIMLVVIYCAIGYFLARTQLARRARGEAWSVSGLSLVGIFPTCAFMHGVYGAYAVSGRYVFDPHGLLIDVLAVPAGLYFLWVVRGLYIGSLRDWNSGEAADFRLAAALS